MGVSAEPMTSGEGFDQCIMSPCFKLTFTNRHFLLRDVHYIYIYMGLDEIHTVR